MAVITISREAGSGGDEIAQSVAKTLAYRLVDKHFLEHVLGQYGLIEFDQEYDSMPTFWEKFDAHKADRREQMVKLINQAVSATAQIGNVVILGRSGFLVLGDCADVLNVRIQAPAAFRVARMAEQLAGQPDAAAAAVAESDRVRAEFIETFYGATWHDAAAFDLIINTAKIPPGLAVRWLVDGARALDAADLSGRMTTAALQVDNVMRSAVAQQLARAYT
ncbi:MAG: cytidylate kinase-like family protein [Caldilineaceae bacterium]|nr:cytidylate kinase-like family protein [Caldilineaceae bacterium]